MKLSGTGEIIHGMVAAYLAKYATKSTETTGHVSGASHRRRLWQRTLDHDDHAAEHDEQTTVVMNTLAYTGAGWRNTGDALLANAAAAAARERDRAGRDVLTSCTQAP